MVIAFCAPERPEEEAARIRLCLSLGLSREVGDRLWAAAMELVGHDIERAEQAVEVMAYHLFDNEPQAA